MFSIKLKNVLFILIGSAVYAFGIVHFNIENHLAEGGLTGVTLILYALFGIDPGLSNLLLNIPLFLIGWRLLGRNVFIYTIVGTVAYSMFVWLFLHTLRFNLPLHEDMTLAALFAGVFGGVGLGIIFRYGGTTGGSDILARLANKYIGWSVGKTFFVTDVLVLGSSLVYLSYHQVMYTLVAVFVGSRVIDFIQKGAYAAKAATIISAKNKEIAKKIISEMDRGATVLRGTGGFTGEEKDVLYCVVGRNEIFRLKTVIRKVDPHAFVAVNDIHEALGEGFTLDENKNPIVDD
ncbi:MAG TPA: YitT family protein [Bacillales bacterium]|nr:YitT family protein [Bacillales bacterium]